VKAERRPADALIAWLVVVTFLVVTALAGTYVWRMSRLADRARFQNAVQGTRAAVEHRLDAYINLLRASGGLFSLDRDPSSDELRQFIQHIDVQRRYPGIQGVGFSRRMTPAELPAVTAEIRKQHFADFRVWPDLPRGEYHSIVVIEPLDRRNRAAIGYDMFTEPTRRVAMERARDSGEAAASGPVVLVQEIDAQKQLGFLIFVPIYSGGDVPSTLEERRQRLTGFIFAPFRAEDLLGTLLTQRQPEVDFEVYDGRRLLFVSGQHVEGPSFTSERRIDVGGRVWTIRYYFRRSTGGAPVLLTLWTVLGGLVITALLFALVRVQVRARGQAESIAEQLRESESELQKASRAKDDFLATLSHELRTPMTAIIGWSKLMASSDLDRETLSVAVEAIQQSSRTQGQLIDDLLDVSRITAGKMRIEKRPLDLRPLVRLAVEAVSPVASAKKVAIESRFAEESVHVSGDPQRLQQIVLNLMTNAVKFTPRGGRVAVDVRIESDRAVFEVTDTGYGIEAEFLPHVFERFRQADSSTTRSHTGLGLGLAIVSHLVELHGGEVAAHSAGRGKGARFSVTLPRLPGAAPASVESGDQTSSGAMLAGTHVLVVDDEENVRSYVAAVFRRNHAEVRCAKSVQEALTMIQGWLPDVIVTDLGMPEIDGYGFLERIRSDEFLHRVPVIALTAYARGEDRERAVRAGFDLYVTKPVEPVVLLRAVAAVIRERIVRR